MIKLKRLGSAIAMLVILAVITQCVSAQSKDKVNPTQTMDIEAPVKINNPYHLVQYDGEYKSKGFTIYLMMDSEPELELEYIYFKGKKVPLKYDEKNVMYVGEYIYPVKKDLIMSDDPNEESKNELPPVEEKIPFELKEKEGVIAYKKDGKTRHFKLLNIPNRTR